VWLLDDIELQLPEISVHDASIPELPNGRADRLDAVVRGPLEFSHPRRCTSQSSLADRSRERPWLMELLRRGPPRRAGVRQTASLRTRQHKSYMFNAANERIFAHLQTLRDFLPSQRAATLNIEKVIEEITSKNPATNP